MGGTTNAERTRRAFELWNRRDFDSLLEFFHEDAVWDMSPFQVAGLGAFRGHDGLRAFFAEWLETFPDRASKWKASRSTKTGRWRWSFSA